MPVTHGTLGAVENTVVEVEGNKAKYRIMPDQSWFLLQLPGSLRELLK
jgi:hypothetical protein